MQGEGQAAYQQFQQALRLNPDYGPALMHVGQILESQKRWKAALSSYRKAVQAPNPPINALRRLAWVLATCPDAALRHGELSMKMARKCVEITRQRDAESLSTLAAACAETGEFARAIQWQQKALQLVGPQGKPSHTARLRAFQERKPFRTR